jgi:hypothetical protein
MASLFPQQVHCPFPYPSFAVFPSTKNLVVRSWNVSFLRLLVDSLVVRVFNLQFSFSVVAEAKKQFCLFIYWAISLADGKDLLLLCSVYLFGLCVRSILLLFRHRIFGWQEEEEEEEKCV